MSQIDQIIDFNIPQLGSANNPIQLSHTDDGAIPAFYEIPRFSGNGIAGLISNQIVNNRGRITFLQDGKISMHAHRDLMVTAVSPADSGADSILVWFMVITWPNGQSESFPAWVKFGSASIDDYTIPLSSYTPGKIDVVAGTYLTSNMAFKLAIDPNTQVGTPTQRAAATTTVNCRFAFNEPVPFLDEFIRIRYETKEVAELSGIPDAPTFNLPLFKIVVAPEYANEGDTTINTFAAAALTEIDQAAFGATFLRAWANLTAHFIFTSKRSPDITGALDSVKVGQVEHRYINQDRHDQDSQYLTNKYGKEYLRLRRQILRGPITLGQDDFPRQTE